MTQAARTPQPRSIEPRGLSRPEAAAYVGIGSTLFDALVRDGKFPQPARLNGRLIWDRKALDRAMDELFDAPANLPQYNDPWANVSP